MLILGIIPNMSITYLDITQAISGLLLGLLYQKLIYLLHQISIRVTFFVRCNKSRKIIPLESSIFIRWNKYLCQSCSFNNWNISSFSNPSRFIKTSRRTTWRKRIKILKHKFKRIRFQNIKIKNRNTTKNSQKFYRL